MVTRTVTLPALPAGTVTVMEVAVSAVTVPATPPKVTDSTGLLKLVPTMTTLFPPANRPLLGVMEVMVGTPPM